MTEPINPFSLSGKTILVTGASSGIGKSVAIACSKMGADVIITGRNAERLTSTLLQLDGTSNIQIATDLTKIVDIENLVTQLPPIDGVVHCAGIGDRSLLKRVKRTTSIRLCGLILKLLFFFKKLYSKIKELKRTPPSYSLLPELHLLRL